MSLKEEVCSLEHAKKLKELGVSIPDSPFQWVETPNTFSIDPTTLVKTIRDTVVKLVFGKYATLEGGILDSWTAFTIGQLFELLPANIEDTNEKPPFNSYWLHLNKRTASNIKFIAGYWGDTYSVEESAEFYGVNPFTSKLLVKDYDEKLADCLARLLINILKNKLI